MYDWALSGLQTVITTAIFPIYFVKVAAAHLPGSGGTQLYARANTIALLVVAIVSPLLGAITDYKGNKKGFLAFFTVIGAGGAAGMFFIHRGDVGLASTLFITALIGGSGCLVFYESLLPHIAPPGEMDRVSTAGYAIGYFGGGLLATLNLLWIQRPAWFGLPSGIQHEPYAYFENGRFVPVDPADLTAGGTLQMLAIAGRKVGDRPNVRLLEGEATKLPVGDASVDRAISVQVFEYLSDVDAALAELMRVVRPGGRVVIWDIDWSTLSWHSSDAERMARMVAAWDRHLADPVLPRTLVASLRRAGFTDVRRDAHPFTAETMDPEAFGGYMPALIRRYLGGLGDIGQAEADAWLADLEALDASGAYSFAVLQFCFSATRPITP
jgi:SAM-dependent methyltransferase